MKINILEHTVYDNTACTVINYQENKFQMPPGRTKQKTDNI